MAHYVYMYQSDRDGQRSVAETSNVIPRAHGDATARLLIRSILVTYFCQVPQHKLNLCADDVTFVHQSSPFICHYFSFARNPLKLTGIPSSQEMGRDTDGSIDAFLLPCFYPRARQRGERNLGRLAWEIKLDSISP